MTPYNNSPESHKNTENPLISFCVPTYRRKEMLSAALESILSLRGLSCIAYEIIISDDDESGDLRTELSPEITANGAVHIYKNQVHGQFPNLNNLIEKSSGEWLVFLHDDDLLKSDFLEKLMDEQLLNDSRAEAIWFARQLIDYNGCANRQVSARQKSPGLVRIKGIDYVRWWLTTNDATFGEAVIPPMVTGLVVRRGLVHRIEGFPAHLATAGDGLFLIKAFSEAEDICFINDPMVLYRFYEGTQRSLMAERGHIYHEFKTYFFDAVEFVSPRIALERDKFVKEATLTFFNTALMINGPISWLALHYRGTMKARFLLALEIVSDVWNYSKFLLIRRLPLIPLTLLLLPRSVNKFLSRLYIKFFFR